MTIISMNMDLTTPCASCPFRTDWDCHLNPKVAEDMANTLRKGGSIACWETVGDYTDDGTPVYSEDEQHCAGALLAIELGFGKKTPWMRWMKRIGRYDPEKLDRDAPVHKSLYNFVEAMKERFALDCVAEKMTPVGYPTPDPGFEDEISVLSVDVARSENEADLSNCLRAARLLKMAMDRPRSGSTKDDYDIFAGVVKRLLDKRAVKAA